MLQLKVYYTNIGVFIDKKSFGYSGGTTTDWKINGFLLPAAVRDYYHIEKVSSVSTVEKRTPATKVHVGYTLIDPGLAADNIPLNLTIADVDSEFSEYDDNSNRLWSNFRQLKSLYTNTYDDVDEKWDFVEFEVTVVDTLTIDKFNEPIKMSVKLHKSDNSGSNHSPNIDYDLLSITEFSDIDKMLTPEFLLHERPCKISSDVVYRIVRQHIKDHIDRKQAHITSDYDFCFTVKKRVTIKEHQYKSEMTTPKGNSYKPPKFVTKTTNEKLVDIFEMTHASRAYNGYTVISAWSASSLSEMKNQMESFLDHLIAIINMPVTECQHCNGSGHIFPAKLATNDRT